VLLAESLRVRRWLLNQFVANEKAQVRVREQQRVAHSDALAREHVIAARESAKAAKMAAYAALAAALGAIGQLIVAIVK
jgi:hypothetical protein